MTSGSMSMFRHSAFKGLALLLILMGGAPECGWARDRVPPKRFPTHEGQNDQLGSRTRENTAPRGQSTGSRKRPSANQGKELRPAEKSLPRSEAYDAAVLASKKGYRDQNGIWDPAYLNSGQPDAKRLRDTIESYEKGERGASVKDFELNQKTAQEIDSEAIRRGFTKKTEPLYPSSYKDYDRFSDAEKRTPQVFYTHPDGGMIRVKPEGDPYGYRKPPHVSKSVRYDPQGGTSWENEAFKVSTNGNALPKSPIASNVEVSPRYKKLPPSETKDTMDAVADVTHPLLRRE